MKRELINPITVEYEPYEKLPCQQVEVVYESKELESTPQDDDDELLCSKEIIGIRENYLEDNEGLYSQVDIEKGYVGNILYALCKHNMNYSIVYKSYSTKEILTTTEMIDRFGDDFLFGCEWDKKYGHRRNEYKNPEDKKYNPYILYVTFDKPLTFEIYYDTVYCPEIDEVATRVIHFPEPNDCL